MSIVDPVTPAANPARSKMRRRGLLLLSAAAFLGAAVYGVTWAKTLRYAQNTDDAYVSGDLVQITSEVPGTVIGLNADDTQSVARRQVLLTLDPADAKVAMDNAEANLARSVRQVRTQFAQADQLRAQIAERQIALKRAEDDYRRRQALAGNGAVSGEELSHAKDSLAELQASLAAARGQFNAVEAQIDGTTLRTHPQVQVAIAAVHDAALALRRTEIEAPVDGVVARRSVQVGQHVAAGTPLMAVVPLSEVWVDANFKEVQLNDMRIGQPVILHADLYGGTVVYHGKVAGLPAGSGSAFALLPAQNASGNWIKIVQRLPVRIALDPAELENHPLRVGLSMSVSIDVRDTSGALAATEVRQLARPVQATLGDDPEVEARIDEILGGNGAVQITGSR